MTSNNITVVMEDKYKNPLYGVGGFLLIFLFCIGFFIPLIRIYQDMFAHSLAGIRMFELLQSDAWDTYKLHIFIYSSLMILWNWIVLYQLFYHFKPKSVSYARIFLVLTPFVEIAFTYFIVNRTLGHLIPTMGNIEHYEGIFFWQMVWSVIWLFYFSYSKRVKATYFTQYISPTYAAQHRLAKREMRDIINSHPDMKNIEMEVFCDDSHDKTTHEVPDRILHPFTQENVVSGSQDKEHDKQVHTPDSHYVSPMEIHQDSFWHRSLDTSNPAKPETDTLSFLFIVAMFIYFIYVTFVL